jgi:hypothetical protein
MTVKKGLLGRWKEQKRGGGWWKIRKSNRGRKCDQSTHTHVWECQDETS